MIRVGQISKLQRSSAVHSRSCIVSTRQMAQVLHEFPSVPLPICAEVPCIEKISGRWIFLEKKKKPFALQGIAKRGESSCCLYAFERLWGGFFGHKILETWLWVSLCSLQCIFSLNMSVTSINSHIPISSHFFILISYDVITKTPLIMPPGPSMQRGHISGKASRKLQRLRRVGVCWSWIVGCFWSVLKLHSIFRQKNGESMRPVCTYIAVSPVREYCKRWSFNFSDVKLVAANPRQAWRIWPSCLKRSVKRFPGNNKIGPTKHHKFVKFSIW